MCAKLDRGRLQGQGQFLGSQMRWPGAETCLLIVGGATVLAGGPAGRRAHAGAGKDPLPLADSPGARTRLRPSWRGLPAGCDQSPPVRTPAGTHPNCLFQLAQLCEDPICKYSHFCGVGVRARRMHSRAQFKAEQGPPESAAGSQGPVPRTGRWRAPEPGFLVRTRACAGIFLCTRSGSLSIAVSTL